MLNLLKNFFFELLCVVNALFIHKTHANESILQFGTGCFLHWLVVILAWPIVYLRAGLVSVDEAHRYFGFEGHEAYWLASSSFYFDEVLLDFGKCRPFVAYDLIILALIVSKVFFDNLCVQIENVFSLHRHWVVVRWSDSTICQLPIFEVLCITFQKVLSCLTMISALRLAHFKCQKINQYK
jgi:hypothetical protein